MTGVLLEDCCCDVPSDCPIVCADCPTEVLVTITNVVLNHSDPPSAVERFNQVEVLLRRNQDFCFWFLADPSDVLTNDIERLILPNCDLLFQVDFPYEVMQLTCDPLFSQWQFKFRAITGGAFPGIGCFVQSVTSSCPFGDFIPCLPGDQCNFTQCDPQDKCGPPQGVVTVS